MTIYLSVVVNTRLHAVQARYENAYVHILTILKGLYDPSQSKGALPEMSPQERSRAQQSLLQACLCAQLALRPNLHVLAAI